MVLFKFDHSDEARQCVQRLQGMVGHIPQLLSLSAGVNAVASERAYDVGLVTTFDSLADLEVYREHPAHVPVAAWINARATSVVAVDFEG